MIKHFVGEKVSISLIEPEDADPFVRIAREDAPTEYLDLDVRGWHEVQEVIGMMQHATHERGPMMLLRSMLGDDDDSSDDE